MNAYVEPRSGRLYPIAHPRWCSEDGLPLLVAPQAGITRAAIETGERSLWRYAAALPVRVADPVSLGEGMTPLVRRSLLGLDVLCKLEWFSPTASFKDRGASVMLSILREQGVREVLEDSSGNGGAAIAAYAAAAGMGARILVPEGTRSAKTAQMRAFGAALAFIPGDRQATEDAARREAGSMFYASHNWQPLFLEGTKTVAYELWEQGGFEAPDNVLIPTGAGSNVLGCDLGFSELLRAGEITRLPRLFAVQPEACAPIHAAHVARLPAPPPVERRATIADGAAIARPVRGPEVLAALCRSGGGTVAVREEEIARAQHRLAAAGLHVEPTAALPLAGLEQLLGEGRITAGQRTVLLLTGSGLKSAS